MKGKQATGAMEFGALEAHHGHAPNGEGLRICLAIANGPPAARR